MPRRAAKKDLNHNEIVFELRLRGMIVAETYQLGGGFPDILVKVGDKFVPIEIKGEGGKLTPDEEKWWKDMEYRKPNIARTAGEVFGICGY